MMTSQRQISLFTEDELTSSQVDSHANPTQWPESDLEKKMSDTSGRRCLERFEKFSRVGLWAKTFSALLIGQEGWSSTRCRLTWKLKGTKFNRMYFQLVPSTHRTEETEFGLLPTPTAIQREHPDRVQALQETGATSMFSRANGEARPNSIIDHLQFHGMLPTPTAMDSTNATATMKSSQVKEGSMHSVTLCRAMAMGMLPTPNSRDFKDAQTPEKYQARKEKWAEKGINLQLSLPQLVKNQMLPTPMASDCGDKVTGLETQDSLTKIAREITGKTSQLNPQFVMEMMGFPPDWTELPFLNGEMNPSKQEEMP
jgi:hypothetical protein